MDNYYYLIASLPDLSLEKPVKVDVDAISKRIMDNLSFEDGIYFEYLLLPNDHHNIAAQLNPLSGAIHHMSPSKYNAFDLKSMMSDPAHFPDYIYQVFLEHAAQSEPMAIGLFESKLMQGFYEIALACQDTFIRCYYQHELDLRTILLHWNLSKLELDEVSKVNYLQTMNPFLAERLKLNQYDTLKLEYPWIDKIQALFKKDQLYDMEQSLDEIRWNYIETLTCGSYFNKHAVFGYFTQLLIVDRRYTLKEATGKQRFSETRKQLKSEFLALKH